MGLPQVSFDVDTVTCYKCGVSFSIADTWVKSRREDHANFWCPNGHEQHFTESSKDREIREKAAEIDRLKKQLEWKENSLKSANAQCDRISRSNAALRGVVAKERKRVGNGVCPCCKRTFKQLAQHMDHKHPTWKNEPAGEVES